MKATIKFFIVAGFAFFMGMGSVWAQGWEKAYSFGGYQETPQSLVQTRDSSFWFIDFYTEVNPITGALNGERSVLIKLDKKGNKIFEKKLDGQYVANMKPTSDNGVIVSKGNAFKEKSTLKIDKNGNTIWEKIYVDSSFFASDMRITESQKILISDIKKIYVINKDGGKILEIKAPDSLSFLNFQEVDNNFFIHSAITKGNLATLFDIKYDYSGNIISKEEKFVYPPNAYIEATRHFTIRNKDGSYIFLDPNFANLVFNLLSEPKISRIENKKTIWKKALPKSIPNIYEISYRSIFVDTNKDIVIYGSEEFGKSQVKFNNHTNGFIMILDSIGNLKSMQRYYGDYRNDFVDVIETSDNEYAAIGFYNAQLSKPYSTTFVRIVKTKADKISNKIFGKIAIDKNSNCKADSLEKKYNSIALNAKNAKKESNYAFVDSEGNYQIFADTGKYTVKATLPSPYFKQICDSTITLTNTLNTTPLDILLQKTVSCPYLSVDISTQGFRPCMSSVQTIKYCNQGSEAAKNAYVSLVLDPNLTYETSSIPAVLQANGIYKFALGNVPFDTCATFTVTTKTKCDNTLTGKTLCNKVHIYPDSLCIINNYPKVQVAGNCTGAKIDFNIKNFGQANMITAKNYLIIEDDVMFKQGTFNLGAGQTLPISITPKPGKTYRIIAEQTDATLGAIATTAFEACVPSANSSTGFINQFSLGDDSPFEDEDCRVVVNSFDPNDKQGFPTGVRTQHFIPKNTDIEYMIRFQNTGTDTAFVVVLKDTLSAFLDPATIQLGASSHAYKFDLTDNGIAKFAFYNINLPHEKADKEGSNGFVKFRIKQRANNPNGTLIKNRAGIYFDFNDPIITNTTTHTIGENWMQIVPTQEPNMSNVAVKVFPNPFNESTRIEVQTEDYKNLIFNLLDINGKIIRSEKFDGNSLDFSRNDLLGGFYLYQIQSEGKILQSGKLIVQ